MSISSFYNNIFVKGTGFENPFEDTTETLPSDLSREERLERFEETQSREQKEMVDPVSKELEFEKEQRKPLTDESEITHLVTPYVIADKLKDKNFNKNVIAGILGNIAVETGGSFDYRQKEYGGGNGYGLFQLDFQRPYYESFLEKNNLEDSAESQIEYMHETIYGDEQDVIGRGNAKKLRNIFKEAETPEEVTEAFMNIWEKPKEEVSHLDRRIASANTFFDTL